MDDRIDASVTREDVISKAHNVIDIEKVDGSRLPGDGCGCRLSKVGSTIDHDDEMVLAQGTRNSAPAHAGAQDDSHRPAHAATPVMPLAESMAGLRDLRSAS